MLDNQMEFGVRPLPGGRSRFSVWAPGKTNLSIVFSDGERQTVQMTARCCGFHVAGTEACAGARYVFLLPDGGEFPDPASRFQPAGVDAPSCVPIPAEFSSPTAILSSTRSQPAGRSLGATLGGASEKMNVARRSVTVLTSKAGTFS